VFTVNDPLIIEVEKKHKQEFERISRAMVETFKTPSGRVALEAIMTTLRMFREAATDEDRILQNAGKRILYMMGASRREEDWISAWLSLSKKTWEV